MGFSLTFASRSVILVELGWLQRGKLSLLHSGDDWRHASLSEVRPAPIVEVMNEA